MANSKLSKKMTLRQFDHGYWYATEIKSFAQSLGLPSAHKLRKDELAVILYTSDRETKAFLEREARRLGNDGGRHSRLEDGEDNGLT